jgi:hypothetical protein
MRKKLESTGSGREADNDVVVPASLIEEIGRQLGEFLARKENEAANARDGAVHERSRVKKTNHETAPNPDPK